MPLCVRTHENQFFEHYNANFSTLGAVFALEEIEFQKFDFILIILAYSVFCTCLQIKDPPTIKEVRISPRK